MELLKNMEQARTRDYRYDAFKVNPFKINDGERLLKMNLLEKLTLEEIGYSGAKDL